MKISKEIIYFALFHLIVKTLVFCDELEKKENNRSKRTIGLFFQSLANFLNVQDVENTTPVTFTTSAPGYRRKSPPPKVQKWPPLDLEITPWVLQAVPPTVVTPSTSTHPVTNTIYLTTEQPSVHAQVVIIPLSEAENHLHSKNENKNGHESYLRSENTNPKPMKFVAPQNHERGPTNYRFVPPNFQNLPITPQTEIYYWQKLFPNQRLGKQISAYQPRLQPQGRQEEKHQELDNSHLLSQQYHQLADLFLKTNQQNYNASGIKDPSSKQINLPQKYAEALTKIGQLYGQTINDELSNLGGNDFNREKQENKYRSFIDIEPKFTFIHNSTAKKNDLSEFYLLERSKRLKNLNNTFPITKNKNLFNENYNEKTNVEIVKSVEPMSYDIDYKELPNDEGEKESKYDEIDISESSDDGPTFEMVKSYELPNSESSNGNTDFEFHMDPDENPNQFEEGTRDEKFNYSEIKKDKIHPFRNKKVTFVPPSQRERNELKNSDKRLNKFFSSEKIYDDVYDGNKQIDPYNKNEYYNDNVAINPKFGELNEDTKYGSIDNSEITTQENFPKLLHRSFRPKLAKNKSHQNLHNRNKLLQKNTNFNIAENNSAEDPDYGIHRENINFEYPSNSRGLQQKLKIINDEVSRYPAGRGRVKYHQLSSTYDENQPFDGGFISKSKSLQLPPSPEYSNKNLNNNFNGEINSYSYSIDPSKFNLRNDFFSNLNTDKQNNQKEYSVKKLTDLGKQTNEGIRNSFDYQLQNPEAQLHIFIPEEQSLQSPEKQEKSEVPQYQNEEKSELPQYQNDSPDYYQDYSHQVPNLNKLHIDAEVNTAAETGVGTPRLPDNLHEQLVENHGAGIRRNLVSPPSFDQQTDMTEHKAKCLPQPFVKLKYACNNTAQYKMTNQS